MTLGIYKPGQGYWVRVMTATIIAVATMALAAWLWGQTDVLATKLPVRTYGITLQSIEGAPAQGQTVELFKAPARGETTGAKLGTARIDAYDANSSEIRVGSVQLTGPGLADTSLADPGEAAEVRAPGFTGTIAGRGVRAVPLVEPLLLQGTIAAIVLLLGAILAYYFCALKPGSVEFLIATDMEMKKVNWSTAREIRGSTFVVISAAFLLAGALFAVDLLFQEFFRSIGILGS